MTQPYKTLLERIEMIRDDDDVHGRKQAVDAVQSLIRQWTQDRKTADMVARAIWKERTNDIRCTRDTPPDQWIRDAKAALAVVRGPT